MLCVASHSFSSVIDSVPRKISTMPATISPIVSRKDANGLSARRSVTCQATSESPLARFDSKDGATALLAIAASHERPAAGHIRFERADKTHEGGGRAVDWQRCRLG